MTDKDTPVAAILFFQNEAKDICSQDFVMRIISCEFEISTYNTLGSRGSTKLLSESRKNACGSHLVFQIEAKNIPMQDFMAMNISCKFEKASYNIAFIRAVTVKSLYTLRRRSWHYQVKSIVSIGCYPVDTMSHWENPTNKQINKEANKQNTQTWAEGRLYKSFTKYIPHSAPKSRILTLSCPNYQSYNHCDAP